MGGAKIRGIYLVLFTEPERDSCFSIYQISWIKIKQVTFRLLKTSLCRNFVYNLQWDIWGVLSSAFLRFCCKFSMEVIFYLPVNTDKPKFAALLLFVCTTAFKFIAQISSSENASKRDAILAPDAKQWIAKDIPSYARKVLFTDLVNTNSPYLPFLWKFS